MDSTTLLASLLDQGYEVAPFQFIYGSKHNKYETAAIRALRSHYGIDIPIIDLTEAFSGIKSNLLKSGGSIPEGHYNDSNMSITVVPGRNSIFISVLVGIAESIGAEMVALGVHAGDHHIYPDCRAEYIQAMNQAMYLASDRKVRLHAPFLLLNKTHIVAQGLKLGVPYHLTRTCYKDQPIACGKCGSCQERLEAFTKNKTQDPLEYDTRKLWEIA
jgi:7-cyano-7-deazaguanine synthase